MKFHHLSTLLKGALIVAFVGFVAFPSPAEAAKKKSRYVGKVFLIKGLLNVFSQGIPAMGVKLRKRGVQTVDLNHSSWLSTARNYIAKNKKNKTPVVIVGHSFGANAAMLMAKEFGKHRWPVRLVVTLDGSAPQPASANIRKVTNYWSKGSGIGKRVKRGRGFRGRIQNIEVSKFGAVGHFSLDKNPKIQKRIIREILRTLPRR